MQSNPTRINLFLYGILAMPLAFVGMPLYIHAPDFYVTQFDVSLAVLGTILLVLRLIDAFQDPVIGYLSDRFHYKRLSLMIFAVFLLLASFTALFQLPDSNWALPWFVVNIFLATTAFSILSINLNMLGGLWVKDAYQKTRIAAMREGLGLVGLLMAVILPNILIQYYMPSNVFLLVSIILSVMALIAVGCFVLWYKHHYIRHEKIHSRPLNFLEIIRASSKYTKFFFTVYGISMIASSIPALLVLFFIRDRIEAQSYTGLFLALYFLAGAVGMPLWSYLSKYYGKYNTWVIAMLIAIVTFVWAYFLSAGDIWQYAVICALSGFAFGADICLPPSILADHIHINSQEHEAASLYGMLTFLAKSALAIASVIILPTLEYVGYQPATENSDIALHALSLAYAAIPCAIKLVAVILLVKFGENYVQESRNIHNTTHA